MLAFTVTFLSLSLSLFLSLSLSLFLSLSLSLSLTEKKVEEEKELFDVYPRHKRVHAQLNNGRQRHHRQRVHERLTGSEKSELGISAFGGHLLRLGRVYESLRGVDGDIINLGREGSRKNVN